MPAIEVSKVTEDIGTKLAASPLRFPVASASALEAMPTNATVSVGGRDVDLDSVLPQLPTSTYPIASQAALQQKVTALVTERVAAASKAITQLTQQLPQLQFPIANAAKLVSAVSSRQLKLGSRVVDVQKAAAHIPATDFPIASQADFDDKVSSLGASIALTTPGPGSVL